MRQLLAFYSSLLLLWFACSILCAVVCLCAHPFNSTSFVIETTINTIVTCYVLWILCYSIATAIQINYAGSYTWNGSLFFFVYFLPLKAANIWVHFETSKKRTENGNVCFLQISFSRLFSLSFSFSSRDRTSHITTSNKWNSFFQIIYHN